MPTLQDLKLPPVRMRHNGHYRPDDFFAMMEEAEKNDVPTPHIARALKVPVDRIVYFRGGEGYHHMKRRAILFKLEQNELRRQTRAEA